jgi:hypothetical protein
MNLILKFGWSKYGYNLAGLLLHNLEVEDSDFKLKNSKIIIVKHIIKESVIISEGINSLDSTITLLKLLISSNENEKNDEKSKFQNFIYETISYISEKNENTSQNIDLINSILTFNKKYSKNDDDKKLILNCLLKISGILLNLKHRISINCTKWKVLSRYINKRVIRRRKLKKSRNKNNNFKNNSIINKK